MKNISSQNNNSEFLVRINILEQVLNNLVDYKKDFAYGYAVESNLVMMTFEALVTGLIIGTSSLLTFFVSFLRSNAENLSEYVRNNERDLDYIDTFLNNLKSFNQSVSSGEIERIMREIKRKHSLKEDFSGIIAGTLIAFGVLFSVLFVIRNIFYYLFLARESISDYLEYLENFFRLNIQKNINDKNRTVSNENQKKLLEKLHHLSEKIKVSNEKSISETKKEIDYEDKENLKLSKNSLDDNNSLDKNEDTNNFFI